MSENTEYDFHSSPEAFLKKCNEDKIDTTVALYTFKYLMDSGKWGKNISSESNISRRKALKLRKNAINEFFHSLENVKLYHASKNTSLEALEPYPSSRNKDNKKPLVFASTSKAITTCFMAGAKNDIATKSVGDKGISSDGFVHLEIKFVIGDEERLIDKDMGGCIYEIDAPHSKFSIDPDQGFGVLEPTCKERVSLKSIKENHVSAIKAMCDYNVQMFQPKKELFDKFLKAKRQGDKKSLSILRIEVYKKTLSFIGKQILIEKALMSLKDGHAAKIQNTIEKDQNIIEKDQNTMNRHSKESPACSFLSLYERMRGNSGGSSVKDPQKLLITKNRTGQKGR